MIEKSERDLRIALETSLVAMGRRVDGPVTCTPARLERASLSLRALAAPDERLPGILANRVRLLVDRMHQRRGIGERAVALVVEEARRAGVDRLVTSYVDERGGPEPFYERLGFVRTGAIVDGEVEAALRL